MNIIDHFDFTPIVYPHGIEVDGGKAYAVFKYFISIKPKKKEEVGRYINDSSLVVENFEDFFSAIKEKLDTAEISINPKNSEDYIDLDPNQDQKSEDEVNVFIKDDLKAKTFSKNSFLLLSTDKEDDNNKTLQISGNKYDEVLKLGREFAKKCDEGQDFKNDGESINFISFYSKLLEEPVLAEKYGLIRTFRKEASEIYNTLNNDSKRYRIKTNNDDIEDKYPFLLSVKNNKYYNGLYRKNLIHSDENSDKNDFEIVELTYYDKYKELLNGEFIENDGFYINVKYKPESNSNIEKLNNPFVENDIFGFNVLAKKQSEGSFRSLSITKKAYFNKKGNILCADTSSGYLLPSTTIQTDENTEYLPELLFAWKGENLALNRVSKKEIVKNEDGFDENPRTKFNDDNILNDLIENNFKIKESFVPKTNPQLIAEEIYNFCVRTVTPFNYYLETKEEWKLRTGKNKIPSQIYTFEDLVEEQNKEIVFAIGLLPKYKIDAPVIISRESFENENTPYVDSKNSMVVNFLNGESSEKRFLYPARITWEKFKLLGYLSKENINAKNINQYVRRCMRLEKRALKNIRENQGLSKKINYLADPRAKKVEIMPNDLFTAQYFSKIKDKANLAQEIFNFQKKYPYYNNAKGVKIEAVKNGRSNSLIFDEKTFLSNLPLGVYAIKIHSNHLDNNTLIEKNGEPLNFAFIGKPKPPTSPKDSLDSARFNTNDSNKWRLNYPLVLHDDFSTKSIKFYEQTRVLKLQHDDLDNLVNNFDEDINAFHLLNDEYPVELFMAEEGNLNENLQARSYPKKIKLIIHLKENLTYKKQEIFRIRLSENDEIIVNANDEFSPYQLWFNGHYSLLNIDKEYHLIIKYSENTEKFELFIEGSHFYDNNQTICTSLSLENYINPEINIRDIQIPKHLTFINPDKSTVQVNGLEYLSQTYKQNTIKLLREPHEIILEDEGHPFYRKKKIKLFASSAFQGYFPTVVKEKEIGTTGSELDFEILNNTVPEVPELETDLLMYNYQNKSWVGDNQISEERSFLVRVILNQSFMREGDKNKFAIILGKYVDSSCTEFEKTDTEDFSAIGEDITRMIKKETLVTNNIDEFIDTEPSRKELKKYFNNSENTSPKNDLENLHSLGKKNIHFKGSYYKILVCQPYYNVKLKKWQIILSFKNPDETNNIPNKTIDSFFVKLLGFKISYGHGVTYNDAGYFEISNDEKENTSISSLTKPQIIPVYNKKRFTLKRTQEKSKLKVVNENYREGEQKIYLISKLKKRTNNNLFFENELFKDYEIFTTPESKEFNNNYKEIIVLEFEKHDNYDENNTNFSKMPIKGLRLVNYVQFKI